MSGNNRYIYIYNDISEPKWIYCRLHQQNFLFHRTCTHQTDDQKPAPNRLGDASSTWLSRIHQWSLSIQRLTGICNYLCVGVCCLLSHLEPWILWSSGGFWRLQTHCRLPLPHQRARDKHSNGHQFQDGQEKRPDKLSIAVNWPINLLAWVYIMETFDYNWQLKYCTCQNCASVYAITLLTQTCS